MGNVLSQAGNYTLFYGRLVFRSLMDLATGRVSATELSGPVGIVMPSTKPPTWAFLRC